MPNLDTNSQERDPIYETGTESGMYIHVDYVASKVSMLYESIRHVIDYKEEHLLRENAIERGINRRLLLTQKPEPFGRELIEELIRGGYFANDAILQASAPKAQGVLARYIEALRILRVKGLVDKNFISFLYGMAACEIEEFLDPPKKELLLLEFEYETLKSQLRISGEEIKDDEKDELLYIAVNQTLLRADQRRIYFRLMQKIYPEWFEYDASYVKEYIPMIPLAKARLDALIGHSALKQIRQRVRQFGIIFHTISDITADDPERLGVLAQDPSKLATAIQRSYANRFENLKSKLKRAGLRSVVSILFGKIFVALAIEVPVELFVGGQIMPYVLALSIVFPPSLMFFAVLSIRMPPRSNLDKLTRQVTSVIDGTFVYEPIEIHREKRGAIVSFLLTTLYAAIFLASFSGVIAGLRALQFNALGIFIFLMFVSLIIFSATRIKQWARELVVGRQKEGILGFLFDTFSLPIVSFGKLLSGELSRINVLILLFNLFFEAPFQSFVQFIEEWRKFIREKKEEL